MHGQYAKAEKRLADKSYWVALRLKRKSLGLCLACGREKSDPKHIAHVRRATALTKRKRRTGKYQKSPRDSAKRKADRKKQTKANREWLRAYRCEMGCKVCGEKHPACLEFHHRDQTQKEFQIAQSCRKSLSRLQAEIAKCDVLCANCHKKEHWESRTGPWQRRA